LTLLTVTGAFGVKGGTNLTYVATNLTIGSGVGDNTSCLSLEIPSSSMCSTLAVPRTGGILLTSNFGIPACSTGSTTALQAGTTAKKHLKLTEPVIKSLATQSALANRTLTNLFMPSSWSMVTMPITKRAEYLKYTL
jgi:hypothetical protein